MQRWGIAKPIDDIDFPLFGVTDADVPENNHCLRNWVLWTGVVALVYVLLVGLGIVGDGFKRISEGADGAEQIFTFADFFVGCVRQGL